VDPDRAREILADKDHLTPVLAALGVSLVRGARTERNRQTDDETEDGEQQRADGERVDELGDAGNERGPQCYNSQWEDHLGKH
jgi:hypothetical protein